MVSSMNIHATVERAVPHGANLQRFLIMRAGRPVHAAGGDRAGQSQLTLTIRARPPRDPCGERQRAGCDAQTGQNLLLAEAQPGSILLSAVPRSHLQISAYI